MAFLVCVNHMAAVGTQVEEDLRTLAHKLRKWKLQLAKILKNYEGKIPVEELMNAAERVCPTSQNFGGGMLFLHIASRTDENRSTKVGNVSY